MFNFIYLKQAELFNRTHKSSVELFLYQPKNNKMYYNYYIKFIKKPSFIHICFNYNLVNRKWAAQFPEMQFLNIRYEQMVYLFAYKINTQKMSDTKTI